ncbi:uncharacterized protein LOC120198275 [Hibiscus syriacus]|uniref:uncharacterized protein LOC120198275 n=1 Tax=Hibiscus syriacus TaxID=106335 RepID=UPI00192146B0|nr:uncharacterized protein LOC120198275 [Hibiscus syriacus]
MATTESSKPAAKQLGELLKQQQYPFVLQIYLSERGCFRNKKKKGISNFPKLLKLVICNKLFAIKRLKTKIPEMKRNEQETAEPDRFSTVYNSCTDSDRDEPLMITKIPSSNGVQWQKSLFLSKLIMGDSILSASLWNLLVQTTPDKQSCVRILQEADESNSSPLRVLQQAKKLNEVKMELVESDVMGSTQDWNGYEEQKKSIGLVIGNAIAEEIINEAVKEIIFMFHS